MRDAFLVEPRATALRALNYHRATEALRRAAQTTKVARLGDLLTAVGRSYGSRFSGADCEQAHGVSLVSQTALFAYEPVTRWIRRDSIPHFERHEIHKWQVLVAGAGTLGENELFGRALLADDRLVGRALGPHAVALEFNEPGSDEALFAYAFLACPTGLRAIRSTSCGTKILALRLDMLRDLPIPPSEKRTISKVAGLIRTAVKARETFLSELRAGRAMLEELPEMKEALGGCGERRARTVTWTGSMPTISAWNFASAGQALVSLQNKWKANLGDALVPNGLFYGARSARIACAPPHGVDFVSQRDVFLVRPIPRRVLLPGVPPEMLFAPEGALVIAARGTLGESEIFGRPALVSGRLAALGMTEDLLRIVPQVRYRALMYAFLSTRVGLRLLRSTAVGTKILNFRFDLLRRLPIPDVGREVEEGVNLHIQRAVVARVDAEQAETEALRIMEEEVLAKWLA